MTTKLPTHSTKQLTSLIIDYFQSKTNEKYPNSSSHSFHLNVMNNSENYDGIYVRKDHGFANVTYITYLQDQNGFKHFGDREWYYVMCQAGTDSFMVRADLLAAWKDNQNKIHNVYALVVNTDTGDIHKIPVKDIIYGNVCSISSNEEGNMIYTYKFDTFGPAEEYEMFTDNIDRKEAFDSKWQYIGHAVYTKYRRSSLLLVARYNKDGTLEGKYLFKSLSHIYSTVHFSNVGSLRTFQRMFKTDSIAAMYLTNEKGDTYLISTEPTMTAPAVLDDIKTGILITGIASVEEDIIAEEDKAVIDNRDNKHTDIDISELALQALASQNVVETVVDFTAEPGDEEVVLKEEELRDLYSKREFEEFQKAILAAPENDKESDSAEQYSIGMYTF